MSNANGEANFDAINNAFIQAINDLTVMQEKQKKKCATLEQVRSPQTPL